jgi:hypothetical protein
LYGCDREKDMEDSAGTKGPSTVSNHPGSGWKPDFEARLRGTGLRKMLDSERSVFGDLFQSSNKRRIEKVNNQKMLDDPAPAFTMRKGRLSCLHRQSSPLRDF